VGIIKIWCDLNGLLVMGVGYEHIDQALGGGMAIRMMLLLCASKLVATIISYASGNAGGIFAPSLYLGAMSGGVIGVLFQQSAEAVPDAWKASSQLKVS